MPSTPPVTFLLLAYRQASFVAEAVRSALAQNYENLEIIISDDCSTDGTFEVIQATVADYRGPHRVVVRQPDCNLGLVPHFFEAAALASGKLIVAGGGDDISLPNRVRRLADVWQTTAADGLFSNWIQIDEEGRKLGEGNPGALDLRLDRYFPGQQVNQMTGATLAVSATAIRNIPCPDEPVFAEDLYLMLMLHWRGRRVEYVREPLVMYRMHEGALTHVDRADYSLREEEREVEKAAERNASALSLFERLTRESPPDDGWGAPAEVDRAVIAEDIAFNRFRSTWLEAVANERLRAFWRFRDPAQRRWLLPRLLGFRSLRLLKRARGVIRSALR
jgi:hypothetical protein